MRARRTDANHAAVRDALRAAGVWVTDLSDVGDGVPDLLCGPPVEPRGEWSGMWVLLEVKDGAKPASARKLTPAQLTFHKLASGRDLPVFVVESPEHALLTLGIEGKR